jgi:acetylglutamate kinase
LGANGETFNINADTAAGAIAAALAAAKLMILTDISGVLNQNKELISELSFSEARKLIKQKIIHGGMIPKVETCLHALENDCEAAHILDGRLPHVLLLETFTKYGAGTMIYNDE